MTMNSPVTATTATPRIERIFEAADRTSRSAGWGSVFVSIGSGPVVISIGSESAPASSGWAGSDIRQRYRQL